MAQKTYTVPEFQQRLAKHLREMVVRVAADIQDLAKREQFVVENLTKSNDQFQITPPEPGSTPIQGGAGVPPGQLGDMPLDPNKGGQAARLDDAPMDAGPAIDPNPTQPGFGVTPDGAALGPGASTPDDNCPLCAQPDRPGSCKCLDNAILGKSMSGSMGTAAPATMAMDEDLDKNALAGYTGTGESLAQSEAPASGSTKANPGANKNVSKQQPTKPVSGSVLPDGAGEKVKSGSDHKVKKNPLGKEEPKPGSREQIWGDKYKADKAKTDAAAINEAHSKEATAVRNGTSGKPWLGKGDVPMAKPPSGKVPGGTATPPMASNTSKPPLAKVGLPANPKEQMKQHALAAAPVPKPAPAVPGGPLTHPADMTRANAHGAALGGAFAPPAGKPPVSGLVLGAPKPAVPGVAGPGGPKPISGLGLAPKGPPKAPGVPAPMIKPPVSGLQLARSEKCVFCKKPEHAGTCNK